MKKLNMLILFALALANAPTLNAQNVIHNPGLVTFQNTETARPAGQPSTFHLIYGLGLSQPSAPLVGTRYIAELYYMDTTSSSLVAIPSTISPFKASTTSAPGTWNGPAGNVALPAGLGGVDYFDDGTGETGDFYPVTLAVRIWDSLTGATWETASIRGQTASFLYTQRFSVPMAVTDTQMINQPGIGVPEPSIILGIVLGCGVLIAFGRRKPQSRVSTY